MSEHAFYAALLVFVARKTERTDSRVAMMMDSLIQAAQEIEATGCFAVTPDRLDLTARAFAGVAAFLQKQILPEVVAEKNIQAEKQIRWAVDSAMQTVNTLLASAIEAEGMPVTIRLGAIEA